MNSRKINGLTQTRGERGLKKIADGFICLKSTNQDHYEIWHTGIKIGAAIKGRPTYEVIYHQEIALIFIGSEEEIIKRIIKMPATHCPRCWGRLGCDCGAEA
ncbi:MAG: hypothetical protein Q8K86_05030 [Candidatus Nanopelagicaceae bacterium]|nr:hypothetical protein [Candidatus Nanopelagicaceae bacterium]